MDTAAVIDHLETNLMASGIYIERTSCVDEIVHIEYETAAEGIPNPQLGEICSELIHCYELGWEPRDIHAWAFDLEGSFCGYWRTDAGWFRALDRGDLTETDFSTLVVSTKSTDPHQYAEFEADHS